jgi:hypothetical protein
MAAKMARTVARTLGALILTVAAVGCGNSAPSSGSPGTGGNGNQPGSGSTSADMATATTPADMATAPVAGPDLATVPDLAMISDAAKFVGTWSYGAGAVATTMSCLGQAPSTDVSADTFTVAIKSGNTITFSGGAALDCNFDFTVSGTKATLVSGQTCTVTTSGITVTVTPDSGSMTTTDGMTGSLAAHAAVSAGACTVALSAPATKKM